MEKLDDDHDGWEFLEAVLSYLVTAAKDIDVNKLVENAVQSLGEKAGGIVMETNTRVWAERQKAADEARIETEKRLREEFATKLIDRGVETKIILESTELTLEEIERLRDARRPLAG